MQPVEKILLRVFLDSDIHSHSVHRTNWKLKKLRLDRLFTNERERNRNAVLIGNSGLIFIAKH